MGTISALSRLVPFPLLAGAAYRSRMPFAALLFASQNMTNAISATATYSHVCRNSMICRMKIRTAVMA
jgi:hypothetical protein